MDSYLYNFIPRPPVFPELGGYDGLRGMPGELPAIPEIRGERAPHNNDNGNGGGQQNLSLADGLYSPPQAAVFAQNNRQDMQEQSDFSFEEGQWCRSVLSVANDNGNGGGQQNLPVADDLYSPPQAVVSAQNNRQDMLEQLHRLLDSTPYHSPSDFGIEKRHAHEVDRQEQLHRLLGSVPQAAAPDNRQDIQEQLHRLLVSAPYSSPSAFGIEKRHAHEVDRQEQLHRLLGSVPQAAAPDNQQHAVPIASDFSVSKQDLRLIMSFFSKKFPDLIDVPLTESKNYASDELVQCYAFFKTAENLCKQAANPGVDYFIARQMKWILRAAVAESVHRKLELALGKALDDIHSGGKRKKEYELRVSCAITADDSTSVFVGASLASQTSCKPTHEIEKKKEYGLSIGMKAGFSNKMLSASVQGGAGYQTREKYSNFEDFCQAHASSLRAFFDASKIALGKNIVDIFRLWNYKNIVKYANICQPFLADCLSAAGIRGITLNIAQIGRSLPSETSSYLTGMLKAGLKVRGMLGWAGLGARVKIRQGDKQKAVDVIDLLDQWPELVPRFLQETRSAPSRPLHRLKSSHHYVRITIPTATGPKYQYMEYVNNKLVRRLSQLPKERKVSIRPAVAPQKNVAQELVSLLENHVKQASREMVQSLLRDKPGKVIREIEQGIHNKASGLLRRYAELKHAKRLTPQEDKEIRQIVDQHAALFRREHKSWRVQTHSAKQKVNVNFGAGTNTVWKEFPIYVDGKMTLAHISDDDPHQTGCYLKLKFSGTFCTLEAAEQWLRHGLNQLGFGAQVAVISKSLAGLVIRYEHALGCRLLFKIKDGKCLLLVVDYFSSGKTTSSIAVPGVVVPSIKLKIKDEEQVLRGQHYGSESMDYILSIARKKLTSQQALAVWQSDFIKGHENEFMALINNMRKQWNKKSGVLYHELQAIALALTKENAAHGDCVEKFMAESAQKDQAIPALNQLLLTYVKYCLKPLIASRWQLVKA